MMRNINMKKNISNDYFREFTKILHDSFLCVPTGRIAMDEKQKIAYCFVTTFNADQAAVINQLIQDSAMKQNAINNNIIHIAMVKSVVVLDLYLKLNREYKMGTISENDNKLFERILKAIKNQDFTFLLNDLKTINQYIDATMEFMDASAFSKVEMIKALDEDDIALISTFNSFFEEEYAKYNVEINKDFIMRQINKWINGTKDEELAINKSAEFLIDMFAMDANIEGVLLDILNSNDPDTVMQAMVDEDVTSIAGYLKTYYDANKNDQRKLS